MKAVKRLIRILIALPAIFILSILCWYQIVSLATSHEVTWDLDSVPTREVALVLGTTSKLRGGKPNPYFEARMDAAAKLYEAGKTKLLLVSGQGSLHYSEIRDMTNSLVKRGVPRDKIISDPLGHRTLDSMVRAQEVFNLKKFTVISQPFHNHRAIYICKHLGIDASAYNAQRVTERSLWWNNIVREHLARIKMAFDLYYLGTTAESLAPVHKDVATSLAK